MTVEEAALAEETASLLLPLVSALTTTTAAWWGVGGRSPALSLSGHAHNAQFPIARQPLSLQTASSIHAWGMHKGPLKSKGVRLPLMSTVGGGHSAAPQRWLRCRTPHPPVGARRRLTVTERYSAVSWSTQPGRPKARRACSGTMP